MSFNAIRGPLVRVARVGAAAAVAGLVVLSPAFAADEPEVLAKVNGTEITKAEADVAMEMFEEQLSQVPDDQRLTMVVNALIDMHLIADAAKKDGLADSEVQRRRVEFLTNQALRTAYIEEKVQNAITDDELRARYEKDIAGYTPPEEVKASHILVETEDEAKAILDELSKGGDFAAIAAEKSLDPGSKQNGGDLGFFTRGQMVPEFENEAFALAPGEMSKVPVKTQFGYHIVKVEEKRTQPVPSFEDVKAQILPAVQREKFQKLMTDLNSAATIERFLPEPAADAPAALDEEDDGSDGDADVLDDEDMGEEAPKE